MVSIKLIGPPCDMCGLPATGMYNTAGNATAGLYGDISSMRPRCDDHNPLVRKCADGHPNWIGAYCGTCGKKL